MNAHRLPSLSDGDRAAEQVVQLDWGAVGARIRQAAFAAAAMELVESEGVAAQPVETGQ